MAFTLPKLQRNIPIVDAAGKALDYFHRFFNVEFAGAIERNEAQQAIILAQLQAVQDAQQDEIDRLNRVLAGTEPFTAVNVEGTIVAENAGLANNIVRTASVFQGDVTPYNVAITSGSVDWAAEAGEKEVQTVTAVVQRGGVLIDAQINVNFDTYTDPLVAGIMKLYRDGVEIVPSRLELNYAGTVGPNYIFSLQWSIQYLDTPGAGTFEYSVGFDPGHTATGDVRRRILTVLPLEG